MVYKCILFCWDSTEERSGSANVILPVSYTIYHRLVVGHIGWVDGAGNQRRRVSVPCCLVGKPVVTCCEIRSVVINFVLQTNSQSMLRFPSPVLVDGLNVFFSWENRYSKQKSIPVGHDIWI